MRRPWDLRRPRDRAEAADGTAQVGPVERLLGGRRARGTPALPPVPEESSVVLRHLDVSDRGEFLDMIRQSRELHRPWAYPPERADQFDDLLARTRRDDFFCLLACRKEDGAIAGVFNISQIVRGLFQSAFMGYYAHARHAGQGHMRDGMELVLDYAFGPLALHRLEANIQPGNAASIALAKGAGFRLEGYSPRYLLIGGQWRDHERYAITAEDRAQKRPS
jgi:[ribosomal protein S5]-alanine N-acetyltransferase